MAVQIFCVVLNLLAPVSAIGYELKHGLHLAYSWKGEKLHIECFYDDDLPAQNTRIELLNTLQTKEREGKTDDKGVVIWERPKPGKYKIVADAGAGHRAELEIVVEEILKDTKPVSTTESVFPLWTRVSLGLLIILLLTISWQLWSNRKR